MKQLIALVFLFGFGPALQAKSIWLQCGKHQFNLDTVRERYSFTGNISGAPRQQVHQGDAIFTPGQIDFSIVRDLGVGMADKLVVKIDRQVTCLL